MQNTRSNLLSPTEILDIYGIPILNDDERQKYFTLDKDETRLLNTYTNTQEAIYFLVSLIFFKIKHTFIEFNYQDITNERQYLMSRYFQGKPSPRQLPVKYIQSQIKSKILILCGYQRFTDSMRKTIFTELCSIASNHPRQRQLCKEFLNMCVKHSVAIPGYATLYIFVRKVWNHENKRVNRAFLRYTSKIQRKTILSLLEKKDNFYHILSIKQDMQSFKTRDLETELEKQEKLKPIFEIAQIAIPKLSLPSTTIDYYANLIHFYNGSDLNQLSLEARGLYLLCYTFTRYQMLNDNLLEAFKKRTNDYVGKAKDYAKAESIKCLEKIKFARANASNILIAINDDPHPDYMPKDKIYSHIPKEGLIIAAKLLVDENLDKDFLFWKYIDNNSESIKLNLRKLFLRIDFIVTNHEALRSVVDYLKSHLENNEFANSNPVELFKALIPKHYYEYVFKTQYIQDNDGNNQDSKQSDEKSQNETQDKDPTENISENVIASETKEGHKEGSQNKTENATKADPKIHQRIIHNRCEFLLYMQMIYHLSTNKLTLQYSIKHKKLEDEFFTDKKWGKDKKQILEKLDYPKLIDPIHETIDTKKVELNDLYRTVNHAISNGENTFVKIKKNKDGEDGWSLSPVEPIADQDDNILSTLEQRSIVEVIRFVNQKTEFFRVFEPLLPKSSKGLPDIDAIAAVVLANAIRVGARKMSDISDLKTSSLLQAEASYIRVDTLIAAIDKVNNEVAKLPIYKAWYINGILHGSLDGLKLGASKKNVKARHSKKYFNDGVGVSGYNQVVNFLSVAGRLIGANEYEGHFTFEMVHNQNSSEIKPQYISTDKHGLNALNFGLFDFKDEVFVPRIPKPQTETLWGFGKEKDYEGLLVKPTQFIDEELLYREWDNIQRMVASILAGETSPSIIIRKLSSKNYTSDTKKAFVQYNHIVRSKFILSYIHNYELRRAIMYSLNRGELYNTLYRSIAILNNGELKGKNEIEMEVFNQCTRLIAAIIHYYNAYILNSFYVNAKDKNEKEYLGNMSPTAWGHINLLGNYLFREKHDKSYAALIDQWLEGYKLQDIIDKIMKNKKVADNKKVLIKNKSQKLKKEKTAKKEVKEKKKEAT